MDLEKMLLTDFSHEARRKRETLNDLLATLEKGKQTEQQRERSRIIMNKRKVISIFAASLTLVLSTTTFAYGEDIFRVLREITVGSHAKFIVTEEQQSTPRPIPAELQGKLFDENGNMLTTFPEADISFYTKSGEKISHLTNKTWTDENGNEHVEVAVVTEADAQQNDEKTFISTSSKERARQYTMFDFKIPGYLPEGYNQVTYKMLKNEEGQPYPNSKYLFAEFKNAVGDVISCQMRYMDEETTFELSGVGKDMESMTINGHEAAASETSIYIEIDSIMYMFANKTIEGDEFVKIASSLR